MTGKNHTFVSKRVYFWPGKITIFVSKGVHLWPGKSHFCLQRCAFIAGKNDTFVSTFQGTYMAGKSHFFQFIGCIGKNQTFVEKKLLFQRVTIACNKEKVSPKY